MLSLYEVYCMFIKCELFKYIIYPIYIKYLFQGICRYKEAHSDLPATKLEDLLTPFANLCKIYYIANALTHMSM